VAVAAADWPDSAPEIISPVLASFGTFAGLFRWFDG
jgi:hypothetical protein